LLAFNPVKSKLFLFKNLGLTGFASVLQYKNFTAAAPFISIIKDNQIDNTLLLGQVNKP